ncbi:hypothetical protein MIB92_15105 [Aestuariirhabdus sp. Z084]|uniref:cytochrome c family protein n=1 Tax=Aestuariirhabdus haliotis TaxID=2918751 RepID=UPI00201B3977|nr:cytochrome c family protein [Aestuariirhabdus haliotis]MCL6416988.1 hypothetical protein [Aestuariirhabdus haliotis]MCL6421005.1 hypothetical protein [Aestuariirhabdus haliotis]
MKLPFALALAALINLLAVTVQAAPVTLIYSSNLDGELEPCGCTESGDMGGLKRRASVLEALRKDNPELVVISAGGLLSAQMTSNPIKNRYILSAIDQLDYDVVGLQWTDLSYGFQALNSAPLPWVASNWHDEQFAKAIKIERAQASLHYFQWLDPKQSPYRQMGTGNYKTQANPETLMQALKVARQHNGTTVVGTTLTLERARQELPLELIDLLLIEARYEELGEPQLLTTGNSASTLVIQPGSRGMRLGQLDLEIATNGRIKSWQHQEIKLPPSVGDAPSMADWYSAYNEEIKRYYQQRVEQRKALRDGSSPFLGNGQCAACHSTSAALWKQSEHAKAIADLQAVGKSYDPECLACHTLGLNTEGGYLDQLSTPHLANVLCENCHGAGREHVESVGQIPPPIPRPNEANCQQCHNRSHSPEFNFPTYWDKIRHGKEATLP